MYTNIYAYTYTISMQGKERRETITKFISEHQYCTAEDLVLGVKDKISRVPVFDTLSDLLKEGIVKDQNLNRKEHRFVVDANNPIVETSRELDEFENAYISFLEKVKEHINKRYYELKNHHYSDPEPSIVDEANRHPFRKALSGEELRALDEAKEFFYASDLISRSLHIFSEVLKMYMLRSITIWPSIIKDRQFLNLINSAVFSKFSDIQMHMNEVFRSIIIPIRGNFSLDSLSDDALLDTFTEL